MTALEWDKVGERVYQTGVDRGVLYLKDGRSAVWNGLTSVEDTATSESKSFYLDGVKYLETVIPGDYEGKLQAFTYPDELDELTGIKTVVSGVVYYDQPSQSFNLSYRTKVGNDVDGLDYGYKIHLLYNVLAKADSYKFDTLKEQSDPSEFVWTLSGIPPKIGGYRPTAHVAIESTNVDSDILEILENSLYGTDVSDPRFPTIIELAELFQYQSALLIIDNGDGTWTAVDQGSNYITMLDGDTFQIENADADFLDASTYEISSTNVE